MYCTVLLAVVPYLSVAVLLVHVAALLEQQARDVRVAVRGGAAQQRRPERAAIGQVHVGAHLEQLAHRLKRLSVHRRVQRRAARCVTSNARVERRISASIIQWSRAMRAASFHELIMQFRTLVLRVEIGAAGEQKLNGVQLPREAREHQRCLLRFGLRIHVSPARQQKLYQSASSVQTKVDGNGSGSRGRAHRDIHD